MNQFSKSWEIHSDLLWSHFSLWGGSLLCWNYMYLFMYVLLWASISSTILSKVNELCPATDEIVPCSWFSLICSSVLSQPPQFLTIFFFSSASIFTPYGHTGACLPFLRETPIIWVRKLGSEDWLTAFSFHLPLVSGMCPYLSAMEMDANARRRKYKATQGSCGWWSSMPSNYRGNIATKIM